MRKRSSYKPKGVRLDAWSLAMHGATRLTTQDQLTRAARVRCSVEDLAKDAANMAAWRDVFDAVNYIEAFAHIGLVRHAKDFLAEHQDNIVAALDRQRETGSNVLRPVEIQLLRDLAATWAEVLTEVTCREYFEAETRVTRKVQQALKAGSRGSVRLITPPQSFREAA